MPGCWRQSPVEQLTSEPERSGFIQKIIFYQFYDTEPIQLTFRASALTGADRIPNMFDGPVANQRDIKPNIGPAPFVMIGKHRIRGLKQPGLLPRQHRICPKRETPARFYLNKNQRRRIGYDQVDLTGLGAQTLRQNLEALGSPMGCNE